MKYLLDTCVISEPIKARPNRNVLDWLGSCDEEDLYLSVLTLGEIQKGILKLPQGSLRNSSSRWLNGALRNRFAERILPIDEAVAIAWGTLQGEAENRGRPIPTIDGLLAATAIAGNLVVVTRNEQDILPTGARVLNPWKPEHGR